MTRRHPARTARGTLSVVLTAAMLLAGCNEFSLSGWPLSAVAVTAGDFDRVSDPLDRMVVQHQTYEGIISTATWDPTYNHEAVALKVEDLLGSSGEMGRYSAIIVASGTRGLGLRQYNALQPDDHLIAEPSVIDNARAYVQGGGVLVVTDWAYDLVEQTWPDAIAFYGDDATYDAAQRGEIGRVAADIVDAEVSEALGYDAMGVRFDYSNWAVIESVSEDVRVVVRGSVQYRPAESEEAVTLPDAPLMVAFQPRGARGKVVFMNFHIDAQVPQVMDDLISQVVGTFEAVGGGSVAVD